MRKLLVFGAVALFLGISGIAGANSTGSSGYCDSDCQNNGGIYFYDEKTDGNFFDSVGETYTWIFNLDTDSLTPSGVNIDPGDIINKARLSIYAYDDKDRTNEYADLVFDGSTIWTDYEVNTQTYKFNVQSYFSSTDHRLSVAVTQSGNGSSDFGISRLKLEGCYTDVTPHTAVPEPASLILLGLGLIGLAVAGRKFQK